MTTDPEVSLMSLTAAAKRYLVALESEVHNRRGRRSPEGLRSAIEEFERTSFDDPLSRLKATQRNLDRIAELEALEDDGQMANLEADFIEALQAGWATRKGYTYTALRQVGVPAKVLKAGGLTRSS